MGESSFAQLRVISGQARNQGRRIPLEKFLPPGKMSWTSFTTVGRSSKNLGPSENWTSFTTVGRSSKNLGPSENSSPLLMSQAGYGPVSGVA